MIVLECKLKGKLGQYQLLDEAIRTALFVRNKALRFWLDNRGVGRKELMRYNTQLRAEFEWCKKLNSHAGQASVDRAWFAITRFYANCKAQTKGKKGFPNFKKRGHSVEYKTSGWQLSTGKKFLTFTDGFKAGKFKLIGTRNLNFYAVDKIKRVRVVKKADGYYAQFIINIERQEKHESTGKQIGIDLGLEFFYTDSNGEIVSNPRYLRKSERSLKRQQRRVSSKQKGSRNRRKAINKLARKHLKVSRQRRDFAVKTARALVQSSDWVVYEDLKVKNLVKNHHLAKSISDASWSIFVEWLEYFAKIYNVPIRAVAPHYTSQNCSGCNSVVKKSLSTRTHQCSCGVSLHRDWNAAKNILAKGLSTDGQSGINAWGQNTLYPKLETVLDKVTG
ncbi:MAG: IS200/IS605 family element transposase accessory protein TnpB [Hydrococcus sp. RU_2_2]|nr:IS200/IS605 family element transposase accessory protein TnpB [Hydrococcus sp. RU_2_2]